MPNEHHACPWWMGYFLLNPIRRLGQNPHAILSPYVQKGMTVLEIGPGMGYFTLPLARMAGPGGRIISVDIQEKMISGLRKRAERAGLSDRIETRLTNYTSLGVGDLGGSIDFALAFAVVHEVPDQAALFRELHAALKDGGLLLMADPSSRFSGGEYEKAVGFAADAGFCKIKEPGISRSRAALLKKEPGDHPGRQSSRAGRQPSA